MIYNTYFTFFITENVLSIFLCFVTDRYKMCGVFIIDTPDKISDM